MSGSEVALMRELYHEHAAALWSYCLSLAGGDRGRAEDMVQETLLRAWRNPRVLDQSTGSARGWLFTVARRIDIDEWRSRRTLQEVSTADLPEVPTPDRTDEFLQSWVVADALTRLSTEHRAVIVECYYRGQSVADAARTLDIPEGTVKSRTHYALRALRLALEEMGVGS
ncbi:MAG TPA: sigma-70 family RNA polymerase sigma factor [Actinomycetes bacterium]|nr:sigma-70 family RNA polymerase sigma factor [Actinomycetes bacterium]